jgi:phage-related protein
MDRAFMKSLVTLIVNLGDTVYVLHAFQKKSKKGIKTPKEEIVVIEERLKKLKTMLQDKR